MPVNSLFDAFKIILFLELHLLQFVWVFLQPIGLPTSCSFLKDWNTRPTPSYFSKCLIYDTKTGYVKLTATPSQLESIYYCGIPWNILRQFHNFPYTPLGLAATLWHLEGSWTVFCVPYYRYLEYELLLTSFLVVQKSSML